jgi:hypothetical protein
MHVAAILSFLAAIICPKELAGRPSSCLIWTFPFPSPLAGVFVPPPSKAFTFTVALTYAPACKKSCCFGHNGVCKAGDTMQSWVDVHHQLGSGRVQSKGQLT